LIRNSGFVIRVFERAARLDLSHTIETLIATMAKGSLGVMAPNRWVTLAICVAMLIVFWALSRTAIKTKSSTFDEPIHTIGGWTHLRFGDFRNNYEDPPLWQYWAALPCGKDALKVNWTLPSWTGMNAFNDAQQWIFAIQTLYRTPGNDGEAFVQQMRGQMVFIGVLLGAVIGWWSWRLGGALAAIAATAFFAFDPNFLAHAAVVKNDVAMSLVMLVFAIATWKLGQKITILRILGFSLSIGLGLTVKFSAGLLVPMAFILFGIRVAMRAPWPMPGKDLVKRTHKLLAAACVMVIAGFISVLCIWAAYGFRYHAANDPNLNINTKFILAQAAATDTISRHPGRQPTEEELKAWQPDTFTRAIVKSNEKHLLPEAWLNGLLFVHARSTLRSSYLMGKKSDVGFWYYFPMAMLFKTATATLVAGLVLLCTWAVKKSRLRKSSPPLKLVDRWTMWTLVIPFGVYLFSVMTSNLNIGLRHVLPLYPFIYVWIGIGAAWALPRFKRLGLVLSFGIAIALVVETCQAWPNYLAFFNAPSGGYRGGFYLLGDSNLDWGQDLPLLAQWQKQHPNRKLYLCYFGMCDPEFYGINYTNLPGGYPFGPPVEQPQGEGIIAVSATALQGVYLGPEMYAQLRAREPLEVLGGTIYLYKHNIP
jgi:hypothetical protein